jgi:hypothetical protein
MKALGAHKKFRAFPKHPAQQLLAGIVDIAYATQVQPQGSYSGIGGSVPAPLHFSYGGTGEFSL